MKLEIVIQELLFTKDFITIPGLGSLVSQYQPARIIKSDHVKFVPPQKIIAFNASVNSTDTSLLDALCNNYNLSKEQAEKEIHDFVDKTKEILEAQKIVHFSGIGDLLVDSDGLLTLKQEADKNFLLASYGLRSFHVHAIPKEDALQKAIEKHGGKIDSIQKKIAKTVFLSLPIIFALILIPNIIHLPQSASVINFFRNTEVRIDASNPLKPSPSLASKHFSEPEPSNVVYDTPLTVQTPPQDYAQTYPEQQEIIEPEIPLTEPAQITAEAMPAEDLPQFFIIVGSFSDESRAEAYANQLRAQSHEAGVVIRDSRIRVYISLYESREIALSSLEKIKNIPSFKDAWLYADS